MTTETSPGLLRFQWPPAPVSFGNSELGCWLRRHAFYGYSMEDTQIGNVIEGRGTVHRGQIIANQYITDPPFMLVDEFVGQGEFLERVVKSLAILIAHAERLDTRVMKVVQRARVKELPFRFRMDTNERVNYIGCRHTFRLGQRCPCRKGMGPPRCPAMPHPNALEALTEFFRHRLKQFIGVEKQGCAAVFWQRLPV